MSRPHPLFNVNNIGDLPLRLHDIVWDFLIRLWLLGTLKIRTEVLQESHFLL
jgi:hypothetical protein